MKSIILSLLLFMFCMSLNAQKERTTDFIPQGFIIQDTYTGDLNKDGKEDCILIIKQTYTNMIVINRFNQKVDRNKRGIIVLFQEDGTYQIADKNNDCFLSENGDGGVYFAPELEVKTKNNNLILRYNHGRYGFWEYKFRFQEGLFKLIGYDASHQYGPVINRETSINFLTKKKLIRQNVNENATGNDEVFEETWSTIKIDELVKLSEIENFEEFEINSY